MKFDLAQYACSPGKAYILLGIGFEVCQVQRESTGYVYQVKNANAETLWFDERFIYRGLDTSPNPAEVYAQFSGNSYGAVWAGRYMEVGEAFKRNPTIRWWTRSGQPIPQRTATVTDWIRLVRHYPSFQSPFGALVNDVIELYWLPDEGGRPGNTILERYYYARNIGLVGFGGDMGKSGISNNTPDKPPVREKLAWFQEPVPPPVVREEGGLIENDGPFVDGVLEQIPGTFVNVRRQPVVQEGNQFAQLQRGAGVKFRDVGDWYEVEILVPMRGYVSKQGGRVVIRRS